MEDKVIQQSFTFKNSDRMTAQAKKTATNIQKRKWQVKEMVLQATKTAPNSRGRNNNYAVQIDRIRVAAYCRVSTDGDEQLGSFESQKLYYEEKIRKNKEWAMAGIFADEAITGTKIDKREGFQEMIRKCLNGEIDMILTKSISRFSRNTPDTIKYVRMLRDKNIAIMFEKENINTLDMNGEMLLTILSSLAQEEVESLSSNVKMGLRRVSTLEKVLSQLWKKQKVRERAFGDF